MESNFESFVFNRKGQGLQWGEKRVSFCFDGKVESLPIPASWLNQGGPKGRCLLPSFCKPKAKYKPRKHPGTIANETTLKCGAIVKRSRLAGCDRERVSVRFPDQESATIYAIDLLRRLFAHAMLLYPKAVSRQLRCDITKREIIESAILEHKGNFPLALACFAKQVEEQERQARRARVKSATKRKKEKYRKL